MKEQRYDIIAMIWSTNGFIPYGCVFEDVSKLVANWYVDYGMKQDCYFCMVPTGITNFDCFINLANKPLQEIIEKVGIDEGLDISDYIIRKSIIVGRIVSDYRLLD